MTDYASAKQHAQRLASFLDDENGLVYLAGSPTLLFEDSDQIAPFRQRRYFYYLSGVDEPNACLTYDCRTRELVLYVEEIDWDKVIWTGRGSTIDEALEK